MAALAVYFFHFKMQRRQPILLSSQQENPAVFEARFSRCHGLLRLIAERVLGDSERVEEAIENCRLTASRKPPRFEYEGAFRGWLLRILIDEALVLQQEQKSINSKMSSRQESEENFHRDHVRNEMDRIRARRNHPNISGSGSFGTAG